MDHGAVLNESLTTIRCSYYWSITEVTSLPVSERVRIAGSWFYLSKEYRRCNRARFTHLDMVALVRVILFTALGFRLCNYRQFMRFANVLNGANYAQSVTRSADSGSADSVTTFAYDGIGMRQVTCRRYQRVGTCFAREPRITVKLNCERPTLMNLLGLVDEALGESQHHPSRVLYIPIQRVYRRIIKPAFDVYEINRDIHALARWCCPTVHDYLVVKELLTYLANLDG